MKKIFTLTNAGPAKLTMIVIAFYSVIAMITYFAWH